jgi:hypothetical protein
MFRIFTNAPSGSQMLPQDSIHDIYKVSMKNGEVWAVDITEAQYGHRQILHRWQNYQKKRCARINEQRHFGYLRLNNESPVGEALLKAIDGMIPNWAEPYGGQLSKVLNGSDAEFQAATKDFLSQIEAKVQASLEWIKSGGLLIDKPEAAAKLSQNPFACGNATSRPATSSRFKEALKSTSGSKKDVESAARSKKAVESASGSKKALESASGLKEAVQSAGRLYAITTIAGKGKGLVATTKIAKGTRILSEVPAFRVPRDQPNIELLERIVENEVKCLSEDQQQAFFDLKNVHGNTHSQCLGIARTNVLPLGSNARFGGLFLEASRINHSCRHNAQNTWNENIGRLTIHVLQDIEEGQEITISYLACTSEYTERQRALKASFKFKCECELCSLPSARRQKSDFRLSKLLVLDDAMGELIYDNNLERVLPLIHEMFRLFDEEGIWNASIARAYYDAYNIAIANGDQARACIFAERAYEARIVIEGDDSPTTAKMKKLAEKLSGQRPHEMGEGQFENWLWMLNDGLKK